MAHIFMSNWSDAVLPTNVGMEYNQLYAAQFRQVLARNVTLRHAAADAPDLVTETQAARVLQQTHDCLAAIREKVMIDRSGRH